jgi:hypothetical protein
MPELKQEDTMDPITDFTIAAAVVAFLLGGAFQITMHVPSFGWGDRL